MVKLKDKPRTTKSPTDSDDRLCHLYYTHMEEEIIERVCDGVKMHITEFRGQYWKNKDYDNCCAKEGCRFLCRVCLSLGRGK